MAFEYKMFGRDKLGSIWSDKEHLSKKLEAFNNIINDERFGFFHVTGNRELLTSCEEVFEHFKHKTTFVQVGIGGSSLGPEMLHSVLEKERESLFFLTTSIRTEHGIN